MTKLKISINGLQELPVLKITDHMKQLLQTYILAKVSEIKLIVSNIPPSSAYRLIIF
jgi:hypothetical protein